MISILHLHTRSHRQPSLQEEEEECSTTISPRQPVPSSLSTLLLPNDQGPMMTKRRSRRVPRKSKNCRNLAKFGYDYKGFRRVTRETAMQLDLANIQHEVWELEQKRELIQSLHAARNANAVGMVLTRIHDYYEQFARGYNPVRYKAKGKATEQFLRCLMTEDVQAPSFHDIDSFLHLWENYSRYHANMMINCESVVPIESDDPEVFIVKCQGSTKLRISRDTIKYFFKPILDDEVMVQRLIGQEYVFLFCSLFYFNTEGRVFRIEPHADIATGLLNLINDPFKTVKLLNASKLTDDGCLHAYPEQEPAVTT